MCMKSGTRCIYIMLYMYIYYFPRPAVCTSGGHTEQNEYNIIYSNKKINPPQTEENYYVGRYTI